MRLILKHNEPNIVMIPGQHDLPAHNIGHWHKSALGVLSKNHIFPLALVYDQNLKTVVNSKNCWDDNEFLAKHTLQSSSERPVFILGMPRSGTSLLEQIISSHPR